MGLFGKKREKTVDFTKGGAQPRKPFFVKEGAVDLRNQGSQKNESGEVDFTQGNQNFNSSSNSVMDFLGGGSGGNDINPVAEISEVSSVKHKMKDLTGKIENLDNEFYRLMQKVELLEKKIERFENRGV
jgi:archaellum component FlaC